MRAGFLQQLRVMNVSEFEGGYIELTGERGTLKKVIESNNYLYVIREYGISRVSAWGLQSDFVVKNMYLTTGKLYYNSAVLCGNTILMLCKDGLYYFDGVSMEKLNLGLDKYFENVDNSSAVGAFLDGKYYLACKLNYNDGRTIGCESLTYTNNTVTTNLLSLSFGLVPEEYRHIVYDNLTQLVEKKFKGHVSCGLIGCQWLMRGLTEMGRSDLAYNMLLKTDYPSFGYMIKKGSTTFWEHWNGDGMEKWIDSQNHVMLLGDLIIWFYENVAGIKSDADFVGFKKIIMRPLLFDKLNYVNCSYRSVHGRIISSWKKDKSYLKWTVTVPANVIAKVYFPTSDENNITEGGKTLKEMNIKVIDTENGGTVCEIGSGTYKFSIKL